MRIQTITLLSAGIVALFLFSLVPAAVVGAYSGPSSPTATVSWQGNVAVGKHPIGSAFNPADGRVFVADSGSGKVSVLSSGSNPRVVATVKVGQKPWGVTATAAPCGNVVAVANSGSGSVSLLSSKAPYSVVNTVKIPAAQGSKGSIPYGVSYAKGWIFVADGQGTIDIIACSNWAVTVVGPLTAFSTLVSTYYDPMHKIVYFADPGAGYIEYYTLGSSKVDANCAPPVPCAVPEEGDFLAAPGYFVLDKATGIVYVTDSTDNQVRQIAVSKGLPYVTSTEFGAFNSTEFYEPTGIAYNAANQMIYVSNSGSGNEVTALCVSTHGSFCKAGGLGAYEEYTNGHAHSDGIVYDPSNGLLYVTDFNRHAVSLLG